MAANAEEKPKPEGPVISVSQAARLLGVHPETVRRMGKEKVVDMFDAGVMPKRKRATWRVWRRQVEWLLRARRYDDEGA